MTIWAQNVRTLKLVFLGLNEVRKTVSDNHQALIEQTPIRRPPEKGRDSDGVIVNIEYSIRSHETVFRLRQDPIFMFQYQYIKRNRCHRLCTNQRCRQRYQTQKSAATPKTGSI